jgi:signal transduction histidine kinase
MNHPTLNGHGTNLLNKISAENHFNTGIPENIKPTESIEFTYTLAHEIRNPLSTINLAVDMLKLTSDEDEKKTCLDIITRNSLRINDLLTDLLTSYQLNEIRLQKYSIDQLIDEVLILIGDRLTMKNIKVSKYYSTLDCKILLNKEKIKIALTNIIINAVEAMPLEKGELKLITKLVNGKCIVEIEDNGSGISKENMKKIFRPYFTSKPGGMGLGLSSSLDILRANHFHVDVQSKEGSGTIFILSLDSPVSEKT